MKKRKMTIKDKRFFGLSRKKKRGMNEARLAQILKEENAKTRTIGIVIAVRSTFFWKLLSFGWNRLAAGLGFGLCFTVSPYLIVLTPLALLIRLTPRINPGDKEAKKSRMKFVIDRGWI